jgi:hemerythrin superfamily protein
MSIVDKVVAAVTPPESEESRKEARAKARAAASPGDWLGMVLDHHVQIESAFDAVKAANTAATRVAALKTLAVVLTGHSNAEESVLYPALGGAADEKSHATMAYAQQAGAKMNMGLLENIPPMTQDFLDKLEHIRGAVAHHVYEEEGTWFLELKDKVPSAEQVKLTKRYAEEFNRYVEGGTEEVKLPKAARG